MNPRAQLQKIRHRFFILFASILVSCAIIGSAYAATDVAYLPFSRLRIGEAFYLPIVDKDGRILQLTEITEAHPRQTFEVPEGVVPLQGVELPNGTYVVFGRSWPSGEMAAVEYTGGKARRLEADSTDQKALYLQHASVFDGRVFVLAYNLETNSPSGRRRETVSESLDLYEAFTTDGRISFVPVATGLALGGIDVNVMEANTGNDRLICTQTGCVELSIASGGRAQVSPIFAPTKLTWPLQLLEVASDGTVAYALYQNEYDDRFGTLPGPNEPHFHICPVAPLATCSPVPPKKIPFGLTVNAGAPHYDEVKTRSDLVRLFLFDLTRLRGGGVAHYGENNLEGRVAWSNTYYINGLATLASDQAGLAALTADKGRALRAVATRRLSLEAKQLSLLSSTTSPWFLAKRYSLDREPVGSLLHLGRITRALARAQKIAPNRVVEASLDELRQELIRPKRVIEEFSGLAPQGRAELRLRKNIPFWADGSNTPFNYESGWMEGGIQSGAFLLDRSIFRLAERMSTRFQSDVSIGLQPRVWNYSSGDFFDGWSRDQEISSNTPAWAGDKTNTTTAHISYRSMDAMAMLALRNAGSNAVSFQTAVYTRRLVEAGDLYPFVNEQLEPLGLRARISPSQARFYSRSVLAWQVQNQPWALSSIATELKRRGDNKIHRPTAARMTDECSHLNDPCATSP